MMDAMTREELMQWIDDNMDRVPQPLSPEDVNHVAMCLDHLQQWNYLSMPLGDFLTAVVRNDFVGACCRADDTNLKALILYALFATNNLPANYREKAK